MALLDVLPALTSTNLTDGRLIDSEHLTQGSLRQRAFPNRADVILGELGVPVSFPSGMTVSFDHLSHVLSLGAEVEVLGLDTDRAVTGVQDVQAVGLSAVDVIRDDMCSVLGPAKGHDAVAVALEGAAGPIPAPVIRWWTGHVPGEGILFGESPRFPWGGASQGVTVAVEPTGVRGTEPPASGGDVAIGNRAVLHEEGVYLK